MTLGKKIKLMLELNKQTQWQLAEYCHVSIPTANRWCNDKSIPNYKELAFICMFLNCSLADIYCFEGSPLYQLLEMYDKGLIK